jgi:NAD(P)-dependent dehydrogenase (short-subunit alcohol dehydrogenase family)
MTVSSVNLSKKNVIITGASSGIGRACAVLTSRLGARVALVARNLDRLRETMNMISGGGHRFDSCDIRDTDQIRSVTKCITYDFGKIDGAVFAAGISLTRPFKSTSVALCSDLLRANAYAIPEFIKHLVKKNNIPDNGASYIVISSVMGSVGAPGKFAYCVSKHAVNALVRSMALEMAPLRVRVNSISPGVVLTPMSRTWLSKLPESSLKALNSQHPLGFGEPEDIAALSAFLLSDKASWITGSDIPVDGGYTAQ